MSDARTRPDKCDMVSGACACGAWHDNLTWDEYQSIQKQRAQLVAVAKAAKRLTESRIPFDVGNAIVEFHGNGFGKYDEFNVALNDIRAALSALDPDVIGAGE